MDTQSVTTTRAALPFQVVEKLEAKLRTTRAVADMLMCGGAANCASDSINSLGELIYDTLGEIEGLLGVNQEKANV